MRHRSLILGVNGQDGQIMAQHLLLDGDCVYGVGRQKSFAQERLIGQIIYYQADLTDKVLLKSLLTAIEPTRIFYFAAIHGSAQNNTYEHIFPDLLDVNVIPVHTILEFLRQNTFCQLIYASSGKVFGNPLPNVITESTPKVGSCLYGISKITAGNLIDYYRNIHGVNAVIYYFFNHESRFRGDDFFIKKIAIALKKSIFDKSHKMSIKSLNFYCDWGDASEYMNIVKTASKVASRQDLIIASGKTTYAKELVAGLFEDYGLNYANHIIEHQPSEPLNEPYTVDISKLIKVVDAPKIAIKQTLLNMI